MNEKVNIFDAIDANKRNSVLLIMVLGVLLFVAVAAFGYLIGLGYFGIIVAGLGTALYILVAYGAGAQAILSITGARELREGEEPFIQNVVEGLSLAAGIPKPRVWVIEDPGMNAFATGVDPKNSHIVFTRGLLKGLSREELEGVAAHEMSHIGNYDIRFATLAVVMVGAIAILGEIGWRYVAYGGGGGRRRGEGAGILIIIALVFAILAPVFAEFVRLALSRQREYLADATGAKLTRYPAGLAGALEKIKGHASVATASKTTAGLFIANPFEGKFSGLFATHPPIDERIKRLEAM